MSGQFFAIAAAVVLTYLLLRLRQLIGGHHQNMPAAYRAYLVHSPNVQDDKKGKCELGMWPTEIELQAPSLTDQPAAIIPKQAKHTRPILGAAFCLLLLWPSSQAFAQSTIFNIPTTDVVAQKKTYLEFDFVSHLESTRNGGFQTYVPRAVFGIGKNIELGVNVAATHSAAPAIVYLQPNIKWQFYANEKAGTALSAGAIAYTPLKDRSSNDSFGLLYANGSKKFSGDHGARLTLGGYGLVSYDVSLGPNEKKATKGGAMVGYEQPLSKKVSFVADWFSSNNSFGYATPGFSFALPKNGLFNVGYSFGNTGKKNNGLFVYYGITF